MEMMSKENSKMLDMMMDSSNDGAEFEFIDTMPVPNNQNEVKVDTANTEKRTSNGFNETKIIPISLYTDTFTATQVLLLLEMIRFCMEKSAEGKSDDVKEFDFNVHIKNRSNTDFVISVGDEPMPAIAYEKDVYIGH